MFVTKKRLYREVDVLQRQIESCQDRYWALYQKIQLLQDHLGLYEHEVKAKTVLLSKGGPEPSE